jgi:hydroxymethylpyrimidine/phosphomethylpyrimidine kinase
MIPSNKTDPVVLVFSAHDPTGAAGLQADIESINQNKGRCVSVLTAVTTQNTSTFESILPQSPTAFRAQLTTLISDIDVAVCKIGLIGSDLLIYEISDFLDNYDEIPVVLDPVLHAGTGISLSSDELRLALLEKLVPKATVLTPNLKEALILSGKNNRDAAANELLHRGCQNVLITGADQSTKEVINVLYTKDDEPTEYIWERLPGTYHGSGCTLAATISAHLAEDGNVKNAISKAQDYTWKALKHGVQLGRDQLHPDRHFKSDT